ncbi:MAG: hypothetical protein ACLPX9_02620 [Rhodomicrobium sp.]
MELAKLALPAKRDFEAPIRICIASAALIAGTHFLFAGMENATADGQPFSYGIWEHSNFLAWSAPSQVAIIYLLLGKNLRILSWLATAFYLYWPFGVFDNYANHRFKFIYWHQGDVFCSACEQNFFTLSAAVAAFGICALAVVLVRRDRGQKISAIRLWMGVAATIWLLLCTFAVLIS